jgi:superfamily II DNA/RNA helicase
MQRDAIQILIGTPATINEVVNARGGLSGSECRLLIVSCDRLLPR